ncbi:hypothetical protein HYH03_003292 [Edaphochlamys debaryana]|uniref:Sensitive to high expression protein 9, mitochondrial n=1 Tax=Edaphochlamys debaryana TaxID=47281 RepID=A0A835Y9L4_9CHLO|nr:hypothetical protein HYH03_003292 [Edaphochlamys debaryana]|eukprot:KAG2498541.1 hypothetical protein HYH03_003292 [Edaphochlamys debaryana]
MALRAGSASGAGSLAALASSIAAADTALVASIAPSVVGAGVLLRRQASTLAGPPCTSGHGPPPFPVALAPLPPRSCHVWTTPASLPRASTARSFSSQSGHHGRGSGPHGGSHSTGHGTAHPGPTLGSGGAGGAAGSGGRPPPIGGHHAHPSHAPNSSTHQAPGSGHPPHGSSNSSSSSGTASGAGAGGGGGPPPVPALVPGGSTTSTALASAQALGSRAGEGLARAGAMVLARALELGARLNQVTGYAMIEQLKIKVDEADAGLAAARMGLREGKAAFDARVAEHADVQRQLMGLLQRKGSWGPADVERFADLCRDELGLEGAVAQAKAGYAAASEDLEAAHSRLLSAIRERYSAETLWSDKIRRASTWWTAALMGLHLVSFLSIYLVMEPMKARRLRSHVESVLRAELGQITAGVAQLRAEAQEAAQQAQQAQHAPAAGPGLQAAQGQGAGQGQGQQPGAGLVPAVVADALGWGGDEAAERGGVLSTTAVATGSGPGSEGGAQGRGAAAEGATEGEGASAGRSAVAWSWEGPGQAGTGAGEAGTWRERVGGVWKRTEGWRRRAGEALGAVAGSPEVRAGAAAFAGAALGVGVSLMLAGRGAGQ